MVGRPVVVVVVVAVVVGIVVNVVVAVVSTVDEAVGAQDEDRLELVGCASTSNESPDNLVTSTREFHLNSSQLLFLKLVLLKEVHKCNLMLNKKKSKSMVFIIAYN